MILNKAGLANTRRSRHQNQVPLPIIHGIKAALQRRQFRLSSDEWGTAVDG